MKETILITGGFGFIGSNVILHLLRTTPHNILIFDRLPYEEGPKQFIESEGIKERVQYIQGDIQEEQSIREAVKCSTIIIHMAAMTHAGKSILHALPTISTNVIGTTALLEATTKYNLNRVIIYSSSEVYGNKVRGLEMDEYHPLNPVSPYAASKLATEHIARSFYFTQKTPVIVVRPFNAYGPRQHPEKMIPLFITRLLKDQPITLNFGGKQKRDWVYIEDHARALEFILKAPKNKVIGNTFNIGTGKATTVVDIARIILKILNKSESYLKISYDALPETSSNVGISHHLTKTLGWEPVFSLRKGIEKTINWYYNNTDWWTKRI